MRPSGNVIGCAWQDWIACVNEGTSEEVEGYGVDVISGVFMCVTIKNPITHDGCTGFAAGVGFHLVEEALGGSCG